MYLNNNLQCPRLSSFNINPQKCDKSPHLDQKHTSFGTFLNGSFPCFELSPEFYHTQNSFLEEEEIYILRCLLRKRYWIHKTRQIHTTSLLMYRSHNSAHTSFHPSNHSLLNLMKDMQDVGSFLHVSSHCKSVHAPCSNICPHTRIFTPSSFQLPLITVKMQMS